MLWIRPADWPAVLTALDHLEGYDAADPDPLFDRVVRAVETADGPVDCWVYLAGRLLAESGRPVLVGGDWVAHCTSLPQNQEHWRTIADSGGRAATPRDIPDASAG